MSGGPTGSQSGALRVVVVGTTGSGKTTTARRIAHSLGIECVELDRLHWRPGWVEAPLEEFRAAAAAATAGNRWVVDGNYRQVRAILWSRATHIVWLDRPFLLVFWRVLLRTVRRVASQQELFSGNRESFRQSFLSRDSIIWWMVTTHARRRREYPRLLARPEHRHLEVLVVRSRRDEQRLLSVLTGAAWSGASAAHRPLAGP